MHGLFFCRESEARRILEFLETSEKRIMLCHNDADGLCSASLLLRFFSVSETISRTGPRLERKFVKEIVSKEPDLLIALDLPIDQEFEKLKKLKEALPGLRMIVIDHHIFERDLNSEWTVHINPRFRKETYLPTSYLVYRILEGFGRKVVPWIWIAAVGIIGDYDVRECEDLLKECRRRYPGSLSGNPLKSNLGRAAELIDYAVTLKGSEGAEFALNALLNSRSYKEFLQKEKLILWKRMVEQEIKKAAKEAEKNPEEYPDIGLRIYKIKTKLNITSTVSTYFAERNPGKTVVIRKSVGNEWKISLRNQSGKVNLGELAKKCVQGIGSGGGHKKAAGALVRDWETFKRRILKELGR